MGIQAIGEYIGSFRVIKWPYQAFNWVTTSRPVKFAAGVVKAYFLYELWESAISQMLVVDTCRHGTQWKYFSSIVRNGLDTDKCGCQWGEGISYVYLWRDTRRVPDHHKEEVRFDGPRSYAESVFTIIKFHFRPDDETFKAYWSTDHTDWYQDYEGCHRNNRIWPQTIRSYRTISSSQIGITGSLRAGINSGLPRRIRYNPSRFFNGAAQGAIALYLTAGLFGVKLGVPAPRLSAWAQRVSDAALTYKVVKWPVRFCEAAWSFRVIRWPLKTIGYSCLWYSAR